MSATTYESDRESLQKRTRKNLLQRISATPEGWSHAERRIAANFIKALASGEQLETNLLRQTPLVWMGAGGTLISHYGAMNGGITRLSKDKVNLIHDAFSTAYVESLDPADASF